MIKEEDGYRLIYIDQDLYRGSGMFIVKLYNKVDLNGTSRMKPKKVEAQYANELLEEFDFIKEYTPPTEKEKKKKKLRDYCRYDEYTRAELIRLAAKREYSTDKEGRRITMLTKPELIAWLEAYDEEKEA